MGTGVDVSEVVAGIHRLALPLGIHGVPTISAYLLSGDDGDTLVDCGIAAAAGKDDSEPDGTAALTAALAVAGSRIERLERLVVTHAHIDHSGLAGAVARRSGGELWMHRRSELDVAKYAAPEEAFDRHTLMLADHGMYRPEPTETSVGLRDWLPSAGGPWTVLDGGEAFRVGGRSWTVVHTPGHSPGHICLWNADEGLLCSGDHLLQIVSPPVTFEPGCDADPMGSYLESLDRVRALQPRLILPGHGPPFRDGVQRAGTIAAAKRARLAQIHGLITERAATVPELLDDLVKGKSLTRAQRHFLMAEVEAYLAHHEARGAAHRTRRPDGAFAWSGV